MSLLGNAPSSEFMFLVNDAAYESIGVFNNDEQIVFLSMERNDESARIPATAGC